MTEEQKISESKDPQQENPQQDSELKKNLVAVGKIGCFLVGLGVLLVLYVAIVLTTSLGK